MTREIALALAAVGAYAAVLVLVARWAERAHARGRPVAATRGVYVLAQAVYCTTWTYYGSVGLAAKSGPLFLTVYLGPTLVAFFSGPLLRKLVRVKERHQVTSLADFLSLRYGRSQAVAALATLVLVAGLLPYIALQLKTMTITVAMIAGRDASEAYPAIGGLVGPALVALMLLFTIAFGLRQVRPAERHPGVMVAIAVESAVKLVAFVAAGAFVTYGLFGGFGDVFARARALGAAAPAGASGGLASWLAHLVLSGSAILFLPRQFHVAVVESADEDHLRTASWALPAYLLAINLFVLPIALGGLVLGHPASEADTFVLRLPLEAGHRGLSWLVFLGGFSAGMSMVVVETMALATMISNHLLLPLLDAWRRLQRLRRQVRALRWGAAAIVLVAAFAYERAFGARDGLASIGLVSFAAVLQLAPAGLLGLYSRTVSKAGALAGITAGFAAWAYTLVLPLFVRAGWLPAQLLEQGPLGIAALRPEALFGVALDPISNAVLWSLLANVGALVAGTALSPRTLGDGERARRLASAFGCEPRSVAVAGGGGGRTLARAGEKRARLVRLFARYEAQPAAAALADECLRRVGAAPQGGLSALELAQLEAEAETALGASIGAAAARAAVGRERLVTPGEEEAISAAYAEALAAMNVSPVELMRKLDYHRERERLLAREASVNRFLAEVSERLASSLDVDATGRAVSRLGVGRFADGALLCASLDGEAKVAWLGHRDSERERRGRAVEEGAAAAAAWTAEALGARPWAVLRPGAGAGAPPALREALGDAGAVVVPVATARGRLGTLSWFVAPGCGFRLSHDLPLLEEVARRVAMALENAELFRRTRQAIRARDEFLAVASHELKTPLTPLRLNVQTLRRLVARRGGALPQERVDEMLGAADRQIRRLAGLIDDLLDASRMEDTRLRLDRRPLDLSATVLDIVERYASLLAEARCPVTLDVEEDVAGCWDRVRIEQIVTNLLSNAVKHAPGAPIEIAVRTAGPVALLRVRDGGPGIAPADQERIFRPYERAVSYINVSGFGLGLYIVRQLAEAHGGSVRLESAPGEGSAFTVELPLTPAGDAPAATPSPGRARAAPARAAT